MSIIFVDKDRELVELVKNKIPILTAECGNIIDIRNSKYPKALICTASNPKFEANGGLDKILAENFPDDWSKAKEFMLTENLFFVISVDSDIKSNLKLVQRALIGVHGYSRDRDIIITGLGTGIGELDRNEFVKLLKQFSSANLCSADLRSVDLRSADLRSANLSSADLRSANLSSADLRSANLSSADLRAANLSSVDLRSANLSSADLRSANLSSVKGLLNPQSWLKENFKFNKKGLVVFKGFGNTPYPIKSNWLIKKGSVIEEECNSCRVDDCGCGVNVATKKWIENQCPNAVIWECLIEWKDLVGAVVPYNTDGKFRCNRLRLIKKVGK